MPSPNTVNNCTPEICTHYYLCQDELVKTGSLCYFIWDQINKHPCTYVHHSIEADVMKKSVSLFYRFRGLYIAIFIHCLLAKVKGNFPKWSHYLLKQHQCDYKTDLT